MSESRQRQVRRAFDQAYEAAKPNAPAFCYQRALEAATTLNVKLTGLPDPEGLRTRSMLEPNVVHGVSAFDLERQKLGEDDMHDGPELANAPLLKSLGL